MGVEVRISGASDDLIEVEGSIREEFYAVEKDGKTGGLLGFSDGTLLSVSYTDEGVWRIAPIKQGTMRFAVQSAPVDDDDNYSDVVTLTGDVSGEVQWCLFGTQWAGETS